MTSIDDIKEDAERARKAIVGLGLPVGDNIFLLCHALEKTRSLSGAFVECGVFKGSTFLTANEFVSIRAIERKFIGADTFAGFVETQAQNPKDAPESFKLLFDQGKITKDHYELAMDRLSSLASKQHLTKSYFNIDDNIVFEESRKRNAQLLKGEFSSTLPKLNEDIAESANHLRKN